MTHAADEPEAGLACPACLRRAFLIGLLGPRIADTLGSRRRNPSGVLGLEDEALIAAVAGEADRRRARSFLDGFDQAEARALVATAGAVAVCRHAPAYPTRLLQLDDPPATLFLRGRAVEALVELARKPAVALVGSRKASPHALVVAQDLGRGLAASEITVVSGLALGVDASAHVGALGGGGFPVAVLGGGPDVVYPRANRRLHDRIAEEGVLVSELPPGQRPFRWSFPARNRIMAGLCEATVVIEAAEASGSLITTEFATDLGRIVGAVPGPAGWERAGGSNALLRHGAVVITRTEDVLDELSGVGGSLPGLASVTPTAEPGSARENLDERDEVSAAVLAAIESGAGVDGACAASKLPVSEVRIVLASLEESGALTRDALGGYTKGPS